MKATRRCKNGIAKLKDYCNWRLLNLLFQHEGKYFYQANGLNSKPIIAKIEEKTKVLKYYPEYFQICSIERNSKDKLNVAAIIYYVHNSVQEFKI